MKSSPTSFAKTVSQSLTATQSDKDGAKPKQAELGFVERRKAVRTLPVPLVVESDGDTDWAVFQALISDKPTN